MQWTLASVKSKLNEIKNKGYISIPSGMHRTDDGIVGQILEREFAVNENNLRVRDLGEFELKGMRKHSSTLTLCHKTTTRGKNPIQIFDRFGYVRPSRRDPSILKKKLFTTVKGGRANNLGFILESRGATAIDLFYGREFIAGWDLEEQLEKIGQVIIAFAETRGVSNSTSEEFHYYDAILLSELKELDWLVDNQIIVIDFCIDQAIGSLRLPHDRGPHIRVPKSKLARAYNKVEKLL